jgi:hypothetical protein
MMSIPSTERRCAPAQYQQWLTVCSLSQPVPAFNEITMDVIRPASEWHISK